MAKADNKEKHYVQGFEAGSDSFVQANDTAMKLPVVVSLSQSIGISSGQLAMKAGMFVAMLFPLISIPVFLRLKKFNKDLS